MPTTLREFLLYLGASAAALALDTAVFSLGVYLGVHLALSACLGFSLGLMLIYTLSTRHVFSQHRLADRRQEFGLFALIGAAGLVLTEALLWLMVKQLGMSPFAAKLTSACGVFLFNFALRKTLVFTSSRAILSPTR
jgi:putative flippase GtrA